MPLALRSRLASVAARLRRGRGDASAARGGPARVSPGALPGTDAAWKRLDALPAAWRAAFEAPGAVELSPAQEDAHTLLVAALERWRSGQPGAVGLIGPPGSGLGLLLDALEREADRGGLRVHRLLPPRAVTRPADLTRFLAGACGLPGEDLAAEIAARPPRVVVIEDAQRLFVRTMGVRAVLEAFSALILATHGRCLWVLSAPEEAWKRLDALAGAGTLVRDTIRCEAPDVAALRAAILTRQAASDLELRVAQRGDAPPLAPADDAYEKELSAYFARLHAVCGGDLSTGLRFWLLSVRPAPAGEAIVLDRCPDLDLRALQDLATLPRLVLAELLVHGVLETGQVAAVFQFGDAEARVLLERLAAGGLADRDEEGRWRVNPLLLTHVARVLRGAHALY